MSRTSRFDRDVAALRAHSPSMSLSQARTQVRQTRDRAAALRAAYQVPDTPYRDLAEPQPLVLTTGAEGSAPAYLPVVGGFWSNSWTRGRTGSGMSALLRQVAVTALASYAPGTVNVIGVSGLPMRGDTPVAVHPGYHALDEDAGEQIVAQISARQERLVQGAVLGTVDLPWTLLLADDDKSSDMLGRDAALVRLAPVGRALGMAFSGAGQVAPAPALIPYLGSKLMLGWNAEHKRTYMHLPASEMVGDVAGAYARAHRDHAEQFLRRGDTPVDPAEVRELLATTASSWPESVPTAADHWDW